MTSWILSLPNAASHMNLMLNYSSPYFSDFSSERESNQFFEQARIRVKYSGGVNVAKPSFTHDIHGSDIELLINFSRTT